MIFLDTSSLIRFFTNDDPQKALKVKKLLEKEKEIFIPEVVFPELEYVLKGKYKAKRVEIIKAFKFLFSRKNIKLTVAIKKGIKLYENTNLDMADCLIAAHSLGRSLASFDKALLSIRGVKKYW